MAEADKADIFRGDKTVSTTIPGSANTASNQGQSNFFPTFNFGQIHQTLTKISDLNNNHIQSFIDLNNNTNIEYDNQPEKLLTIEELSLLNKHTHLRNINYSLLLEGDQNNPQSPLHSVKTFEELKLEPQLLNGIYQMGFQRPSRIQERALPQLLAYPPRNMIAQSQNGTGKTAAFSLAILSRLDPNLNYVQALILAPTFELALQIGQVIENMAKFLPHIRIAYAVRDPMISKRNEYVKGKELNVPIVIGTPGTVEDWCRKMKIIDLKKLRMLVIDEADLMISLPSFSQICIDLVKIIVGKDCQTMLFSATYSDEVMDFAK
jgi:ATP-dependent RNA helicase DDX19/DBP5